MAIEDETSVAILVDDRMRTTKAGVYAAGDVTGKDQFVYMAAYGSSAEDDRDPRPELRLLRQLGRAYQGRRPGGRGGPGRRCDAAQDQARRARGLDVVPHGRNRRLRHRGPCPGRGGEALARRASEGDRHRGSRHAGRFARHGGTRLGAAVLRDRHFFGRPAERVRALPRAPAGQMCVLGRCHVGVAGYWVFQSQ